MRLFAVVLTLSLIAPGAALARGSGRKAPAPKHQSSKPAAREQKPQKPSKSAKGGAKGVAGAVSDEDRPAAPTPAPVPAGAPAPKGPQRIDFDDRVIEGQSNKSGAVYLYDRKDLSVDSMVKQPSTFRSEISKGLFQ